MIRIALAFLAVASLAFGFGACGSSSPGGSGGTSSGGGASTGSTGGSAGAGGTGGSFSSDGGGDAGLDGGSDAGTQGDAGSAIKYVFVIAMENRSDTDIYGSSSADYINNTLMKNYAHAKTYNDVLPANVPSEPHYIWLEAGTNAFLDHTFTGDGDPTASNSTSVTQHLATQLKNAGGGKDWRAYQEDMIAGTCPINTTGFYAAKHNPFIFFQDVSGSPPSTSNAYCAAHHRPFKKADFVADLAAKDVATYTFITPNQCNDMHGQLTCTNLCTAGISVFDKQCISAGDKWLKDVVPPIIDFINANDGVLFIIFDEPEGTQTKQPFIAVGPHVKKGYQSTVPVDHSSYLKSLQQIFRVPVFSNVQSATTFADYFEAGHYP